MPDGKLKPVVVLFELKRPVAWIYIYIYIYIFNCTAVLTSKVNFMLAQLCLQLLGCKIVLQHFLDGF